MQERIYLYPGWVRLWHAINAILFIVLAVTGTSMHFADAKSAQLDFRTARAWHNAAGIALTVNLIAFAAGNAVTANGRHYRPSVDTFRGIPRQVKYYLLGVFQGAPHPFPHSEARKFNPLQQLSYLAVMYLLLPGLAVTGWVLFFPDRIPERIGEFSGLSVWAMSHSVIGYLLSLFAVVHVYLGSTGTSVGELYWGILSGYVPKKH